MRPTARTLSVVGSRLSRNRDAGDAPRRQPTTDNRLRIALTAAILALAMFAPVAQACPVCFGAPGDPMVKGTTNGVWVLLGFVAFVQIGFVAMFWSFWRRARALSKARDRFHVLDGGVQ